MTTTRCRCIAIFRIDKIDFAFFFASLSFAAVVATLIFNIFFRAEKADANDQLTRDLEILKKENEKLTKEVSTFYHYLTKIPNQ